MSKFIENAVFQALTKIQSTTTPSTSTDTRNFGTNYANTPYEMSWNSAWLTSNHDMSYNQQPTENKVKTLQRSHTYTNSHKPTTLQSNPF